MANRRARIVEWSMLMVVIGIVLALAFNVYARLAADVQRLSFELTAQNFQTAVASVRAHWYIQHSRNEPAHDVVLLSELPGLYTGAQSRGVQSTGEPAEPVRVYLNSQGWPANTENRASAQRGERSLEECFQLWHALLVEPPVASMDQPPAAEADYQVELGEQQQCRYRHLSDAHDRQFFDYQPDTGQVSLNASPE